MANQPICRVWATRNGAIVDVFDFQASNFWSWLPDWIAQYPDCVLHVRNWPL